MQLFNNFTYFLDDPVNGDQFSQTRPPHARTASTPATVSMWRFAGIETQTRIGLQTRADDIHVGLFRTMQRATLSTVREDHVQGRQYRAVDGYHGALDRLAAHHGRVASGCISPAGVASDTPANSGNAQATMTSPKAGIVLGPWYKTEFYGNAGYGLHSNDIRGATITVDPNDKVTPLDRVPLLVRSKGAEIGIRTKAIRGPHQFAGGVRAGFRFRIAVRRRRRHHGGRAGPSRRVGVEWTNEYKLRPWMTLDLDFAYTRARFTDFDPVGDRIPGAPAWIASGGVTFGAETGWFGALRGRYFGPRPLIEDDSVRSQTIADLQRPRRLPIRQRNAAATRRAQSVQRANQPDRILSTLSRLPGEPIDGVADRHVHPAEPLAVRLTLAGRF